MTYQVPLDSIPLLAIFALTFSLVLIALEAGRRIGRARAAGSDPENTSSVGSMTSSSLALLAFLLAFTFSVAAERFDVRRTTLLDEVNAIGTTFLRASTLPEPQAVQARAWLRDYVDARLEVVRSGDVERLVRRSEELHGLLWSAAASFARANPDSIVAGLYLQTLNEMIDLHTKRVSGALRVRVPLIVWVVLAAITAIGMLQMGYQMGLVGGHMPLSAPAFALAFSAVIYLIADLDRPQGGMVQVSQLPMAELRQSMTEPAP